MKDKQPSHSFTHAERDTVLAALRLWQNHIDHSSGRKTPNDALIKIATNGGKHERLTFEEVGQLCEELNQ
jgi:hypothetical protein